VSEREEELGGMKELAGSQQEPPTFYVNNAYATAGPWDVQIRFGHNTVTDDGVVQKWDVQIIQSPTQAKAFLRILAQQLMNFEKSYGPIPDILALAERRAQAGDDEGASVVPSRSPASPAEPSRASTPKEASRRAGRTSSPSGDRTRQRQGRPAR